MAGSATTTRSRPPTRSYDHRAIDAKWQARWDSEQTFATPTNVAPGTKRYVLDMFPYPSGAGLHVGHPRGYIGSDVLARLLRAQGNAVLHPMGWDAFGLPAENYAIQTGTPPAETTRASIDRYREQLKLIGLSYDWSREVNTSDPGYYRWTQWLFLQLFKRGLAYQKEAPVNWCPKDQTVLANEQVQNGVCERCSSPVEQRTLKQWFFKITDYADELLNTLDELDWPEPIKLMQRNWIGRSEGVTWQQTIKGLNIPVECYDSVPQTFMAQTFCVIAPDHPLVAQLIAGTDYEQPVNEFLAALAERKRANRFALDREIEGVFTGRYLDNPFGTGDLPIWIASFVVADYGTGIVNSSAHDERDFAFAKKYGIPLRPVMFPRDPVEAQKVRNLEVCCQRDPEAIMEQPTEFAGRTWGEAREDIIRSVVNQGLGRSTITYKLRDWLVSRQRYWGAPIPIIHCHRCGAVPVPDDQLPVTLPTDVDFLPTGESPLARSASFKQVSCPNCQGAAERETDTMDTFVDSSWYFLRYVDPANDAAIFDPAAAATWLPVDWYVGGAEHAVLHLLYSRFITKALADQSLIDFREPFLRLRNQGLIRADDGRKMSKRWGNVINPDDVIEQYGADTLRCYEMFMGPFADSMPWSTRSMVGVRRWLDRIWTLRTTVSEDIEHSPLMARLDRTIDKVSRDIQTFKFNTAVSALMGFTNAAGREPALPRSVWERFLLILNPFAPHLAAELWHQLDPNQPIDAVPWPAIEEGALTMDEVTIAVQVGGRTRATLTAPVSLGQPDLVSKARALPGVVRHLLNEPRRTVVVPGRIINFIP